MKKIICIFVFFFITLSAYSSEKIVYLDVEKIMQESIAGKAVIAKIKKKRQTSISKFKNKEKELTIEVEKYIKEKTALI